MPLWPEALEEPSNKHSLGAGLASPLVSSFWFWLNLCLVC